MPTVLFAYKLSIVFATWPVIRIKRVRKQPPETGGFAGSKAALPPPAAFQTKTQFVFGIGISTMYHLKLRFAW